MAKEKILRKYSHQGQELGCLVEFGIGKYKDREFRTDLSEYDAIDLVNSMSPEEKIHMKHNAFAVHRLLESYGINPDDYINNEDILVHIANKGYKTLTELNKGDNRAWRLVKQRGLEEELFQGVRVEDGKN